MVAVDELGVAIHVADEINVIVKAKLPGLFHAGLASGTLAGDNQAQVWVFSCRYLQHVEQEPKVFLMGDSADIQQNCPVCGYAKLLTKITAIAIAECAGPNACGNDVDGLFDAIAMQQVHYN